MTSSARKKIHNIQEKFTVWQQEQLSKNQKELLEQIDHSQKDWVAFEVGSKTFEKVTFFQKACDVTKSGLDAIRKIDKHADPFKARFNKLSAEVHVAEHKAKAVERLRKIGEDKGSLPEDGGTVNADAKAPQTFSEADQVRVNIARLNVDAEELEKEERVSLTSVKELSDLAENEATEAQKDYDGWYSALHRPAYNEKLQVRDSPTMQAEQGNAVTALANAARTNPADSSIVRFAKKLLGAYAAPVLLPLEAAFAYPAFRILSPDSSGGLAAAAGATIFTMSLALTGACAANTALRAFRHTVKKGSPEGEGSIITTLNYGMLTASAMSLVVAIALVVGGADMRSKIPDIENWRHVQDSLQHRLDDEIEAGSHTSDNSNEAEITKLQQQVKEHEGQRLGLLIFHFGIRTSDKLVAIGVYLAMFLSAAMTYVLSRDPYLEYSILAEYLVVIRDFRQRIAVSRDLYEIQTAERKKKLRMAITDLRARLWLFDHSDALALDPYENAKEDHDSKESDTGENAKAVSTAAEKVSATTTPQHSAPTWTCDNPCGREWVKDRLARYAEWLLFFRGEAALTPHAESIRNAIERNW